MLGDICICFASRNISFGEYNAVRVPSGIRFEPSANLAPQDLISPERVFAENSERLSLRIFAACVPVMPVTKSSSSSRILAITSE